ncbi:hypothetical protein AAE478_001994 [Parahypoxylon ruwenzoriense]
MLKLKDDMIKLRGDMIKQRYNDIKKLEEELSSLRALVVKFFGLYEQGDQNFSQKKQAPVTIREGAGEGGTPKKEVRGDKAAEEAKKTREEKERTKEREAKPEREGRKRDSKNRAREEKPKKRESKSRTKDTRSDRDQYDEKRANYTSVTKITEVKHVVRYREKVDHTNGKIAP